jgi:serine phosphatase RsbU (regulator of sigma subunit)
MSDPDVGALLRSVPPDRLAETLRAHLQRVHGVGRVEVLLPDYSHVTLWPVIGGGPDADHGLAARCFASQRAQAGRTPGGEAVVHLPLTLWGERVGVLVVEPGPADVTGLQGVADEFTAALRAADAATDRYRRVRRRHRLTMAAELQWELLPGRSLGDDRFQLAGQLVPAYAVCGDHFDWSLDGDRLTVTVLNGFGGGMDAALLTALAVNAMRNARRSGANIVEQAELAAEAIYARHGGARHVSTLLLELDLLSGSVAAVDAGSPRALVARSGAIRTVTLEQQLPVGMFDDARYETQHLDLEPGDRLVIVSDGVHAATPVGGLPFGDAVLPGVIRRTRLQAPPDAVGTVMRSLQEHRAGEEADDDAVLVCLDWRGGSSAPRL